MRRYGLSVAEYRLLERVHEGLCGICHLPPSGRGKLVIDHDATTGEVRGLLCDRCNIALERVEAVPNWAGSAVTYLYCT